MLSRELRYTPIRYLLMAILCGILTAIAVFASTLPEATSKQLTRSVEVIPLPNGLTNVEESLSWTNGNDFFRGHPIDIFEYYAGASSDAKNTPPGVPEPISPGTIYVSDYAFELLSNHPELRQRHPEPIAGRIAAESVSGPRDAVIYRGAAAPRDSFMVVNGYHTAEHAAGTSASRTLESVLPFLTQVMAVPMLATLILAGMLGSAHRKRRIHALRLLGMTRFRVILQATVESATVGAVGSALGLVGYKLIYPHLAETLPVGVGFYATDLEPGLVRLVSVATGVLSVLTVFTILLYAGGCKSQELLASRTTSQRITKIVKTCAGCSLFVGVAVLLAAWIGTKPSYAHGAGEILVYAGIFLTVIGLLPGASVLSKFLGNYLARQAGAVRLLLGRRTSAYCTQTGTVSAVLVLVAMLSGVITALGPVVTADKSGIYESGISLLGKNTFQTLQTDDAVPGELLLREEVAAVLAIRRGVTVEDQKAFEASEKAGNPDKDLMKVTATVTCEHWRQWTADQTDPCDQKSADRIQQAVLSVQEMSLEDGKLVLLAPGQTPPEFVTTTHGDGSEPEKVSYSLYIQLAPGIDPESLRSDLTPVGGAAPLTFGELHTLEQADTILVQEVVQIVSLLCLILGACGLIAASVELDKTLRRTNFMVSLLGMKPRHLKAISFFQVVSVLVPLAAIGYIACLAATGTLAQTMYVDPARWPVKTITEGFATMMGVSLVALFLTALLAPRTELEDLEKG